MCFFQRANSVEKQPLSFRNASVSHCFRNSSLTIIWSNLGQSNYKRMKRNLEFRKKNSCYNSKRNYSVPYSEESPLTIMHLWHISTIPSSCEEYIAERLKKDVSLIKYVFSLNSRFLFVLL